MAYGDGTLSQRRTGAHEGRWEFRLTVNGRRRTATWPEEPSRRQIKAKIAEWSGYSLRPSESETLEQYLTRWLRDGLPKARPRTVQRYRYIVENHIVPVLGDVLLEDLRAPEIQRWVNGLKATQRHSLMCLRAALSKAAQWGLIQNNPAQYVETPPLEHKVPRILSPEQMQRLIEQVRGDPLEALWLLAIYTGMRQGEILGLRWQDISGSTVTVNASLWWRPGKHGREPVLTEPKTKRSRRSVTLHPKVVEALREHQKREMFTSKDGLVFHRQGIALEPSSVYRALHRHLAAAKLPEITFHQIRHSAASMLLASGWDVQAVSDLLGHASSYVTLSVYSHSAEKQRERTAERMGMLLGLASEVVSVSETSTNRRS